MSRRLQNPLPCGDRKGGEIVSSAIPAVERWGVMWMEKSGPKHLISDGQLPALFTSKASANKWIRRTYAYLKDRSDLRAAPHFWRMPQPVRVQITPVIQQRKRVSSITNKTDAQLVTEWNACLKIMGASGDTAELSQAVQRQTEIEREQTRRMIEKFNNESEANRE